MDFKSHNFEIGDNALKGTVIGVAIVSGTLLVHKGISVIEKLELNKSGNRVKDNRTFNFSFDIVNKKFNLFNKSEFEVLETETKTIIKEVRIVPGFRKTKKVQVQVDELGNEIPGTEEDVVI